MRGLSGGSMEVLWDRLPQLSMEVTVLNGSRDEKFKAIGERMGSLLPSGRVLVAEGGHGLPLENPPAVAGALEGLDPQARA